MSASQWIVPPDVLKRLAATNKQIRQQLKNGMAKAGLKLQRASQQIVPVQFGNLKASAFTRIDESTVFAYGNSIPIVIVGYTAKYAVYVHENLEAAHGEVFNRKYAKQIANAHTPAQKKIWFNRGPNQQAKFLEKPAREMRNELSRTVAEEVQKVRGS